MNASNFWDLFSVSIHDKRELSDTDKLAYLRDALKDGPAEAVIRGLAKTGDTYGEAIDCLCQRYDRPRVVHQVHVNAILSLPVPKDGNCKELLSFHDTATLHLRALKAMKLDDFDSFVTAVLVSRLEKTTAREWRKYSDGAEGIPPYSDLLKYIVLQACDGVDGTPEAGKRPASGAGKKGRGKPSYTSTESDRKSEGCVACKQDNHVLAGCQVFPGFALSRKMVFGPRPPLPKM